MSSLAPEHHHRVDPEGVPGRHVRLSTDGGKTFGEARSLLFTTSTFDHPFLVRDRETALLSWFTDAEGLRLVEVK